MVSQTSPVTGNSDLWPAPPPHGFPGAVESRWEETPDGPIGVTVAITRQAGSRGGSIAIQTAKRLGWQMYHRDTIDYLAHDRHHGFDLMADLDPTLSAAVDQSLLKWSAEIGVLEDESMFSVAKILLAIGARGEAVIVGRGAGFLLPRATTVHVRIIAPEADRIAYLAQMERLTREQARERVREIDHQRHAFLKRYFVPDPENPHHYDVVLDSSTLGEDTAAKMVALAAEHKVAMLERQGRPRLRTIHDSMS
jgi:cytidylate kinase